ncbi:MAG: nitrilase-related carbon-nitrogen hydrolase [Gemmataceae bacterium]
MKLTVGVSLRDGCVAVVAGLMGAAAFPPLGVWPLSLVSISLFLLILRDLDQGRARPLGLLYGLVFGSGTMYWMFRPGLFGIMAIPLVALMAGYFGLFATLFALTRQRPPLIRATLAALFAVAIEWLRGDAWYLRFPWYTAPHALALSPMWASPVRWIGTYGLSFVVWFIAAAGTVGAKRYWLAFLLLPACSWLLPSFDPPDRKAVLIQVEDQMMVESRMAEVPTVEVDLAVLPEYAFTFSLETTLRMKNGPVALAKRLNCPVIFGTTIGGSYGDPGYQNVAAVIDATGNVIDTFPKQRPVPLMLDGKPGERRPVFPTEHGTLGVAICYDFDNPAIAADLVAKGATVLVAPTGDLMTWGAVQHENHELLARLRALETDRWLLRCTTSGRTEVIDPHGHPSKDGIAIGESGYLMVEYGHRQGVTWGSRAALLGPVSAGLAGVVVILMILICIQSRKISTENSISAT